MSPVSPAPVHCRSALEWRTLEDEKAAYQRATAVVSSLLGAVLLAGGFAYYYYRVRGGAQSNSGLLLGGINSDGLLEL